jgi:alpha-aminoadipic semialdehyde synthase
VTQSSTLSAPFYTLRHPSVPAHLPPVTVMTVDILPTSLPLDASRHFSDALAPYLRALVAGYRGERADADVARALERATVVQEGNLVGRHEWLGEKVDVWRSSVGRLPGGVESRSGEATETAAKTGGEQAPALGTQRKRRVLMLGSGMVAGPAVNELCRHRGVELVIGILLACYPV